MSNNSAIDIYLRVRPTDKPSEMLNIVKEEDKLQFYVKKDPKSGYINNSQEKRVYEFNELFDMSTKQDRIFDRIAKDVVDGALTGYNGTVFAYGQTGSGKTYTMTGGTDDYEARGIIPRTFDYLFDQMGKRSTEQISIYASYIQIYNGVGYDLCPQVKGKQYKSLNDLEKVLHQEDADGETHLKNLTIHELRNATQARGMLFQGDTNRVVCKTPMNDESTRSHCIFKIILEVRKTGSDIKTVSNIHLVDLSGSERIKNTGVQGNMQYEARSINLTLHYLQRVITCLNDKMKGSNIVVPYRDSLLTMILKNSLGGNCRTKMVATISAKEKDIPESISTCEFAKRIACIKNSVYKNQSVDPQVIITRLRNQNALLKSQLALLKGGEDKGFLDQYDIEDCHKAIQSYIENPDDKAILVFNDRLRMQQSFSYFKSLIKAGGKFATSSKSQFNEVAPKSNQERGVNSVERQKYQDQLKKLRLLNMRQQQQIAILLSQIKKYSSGALNSNIKSTEPVLAAPSETQQQKYYKQQSLIQKSMLQQSKLYSNNHSNENDPNKNINANASSSAFSRVKEQSSELDETNTDKMRKSKLLAQRQEAERLLLRPLNLSSQQMLDNGRICEEFRKAYKKRDILQKNQELFKQKANQGKKYAEMARKLKEEANIKNNRITQLREQMIIQHMNSNLQEIPEHPEAAKLVMQVNLMKKQMKQNLDNLRNCKNQMNAIEQVIKTNHEVYSRDLERYLKYVYNERTQAMKGVDKSLLSASVQQQQVQKALMNYEKARQEIRKR